MTKLVPKLIQIEEKDKQAIERKAKALGIKSNQLIRIIIKDYIKGGK